VSAAPGNSGVAAPVPGANSPGSAGAAATTPSMTATTLPPSRSGFRWRLISSLVLWAIMLAVIFWLPPTALYIFLNIVVARAVWEFYGICEAKGLRTYKVWGVIGTLALISGSWFFYRQPERLQLSYDFDVLILLVFALGIFVRQFPQKLNPQGIETMAVTLFGLIYVAWLANFVTRVNFATVNGRYWVMYLIVVTKFTDIGAYLIGSSIGRHKMTPRISPKKTWEGTIGGVIFAVGGAWLCYRFIPGLSRDGLNIIHVVVLGLLLGGAAIIGDLAESLIKREAGVKDSSTILPGHGGCLDMIDSLLFTAPLLYVYMRLVLR
jgi:phosphatidate cytidylyltransferase